MSYHISMREHNVQRQDQKGGRKGGGTKTTSGTYIVSVFCPWIQIPSLVPPTQQTQHHQQKQAQRRRMPQHLHQQQQQQQPLLVRIPDMATVSEVISLTMEKIKATTTWMAAPAPPLVAAAATAVKSQNSLSSPALSSSSKSTKRKNDDGMVSDASKNGNADGDAHHDGNDEGRLPPLPPEASLGLYPALANGALDVQTASGMNDVAGSAASASDLTFFSPSSASLLSSLLPLPPMATLKYIPWLPMPLTLTLLLLKSKNDDGRGTAVQQHSSEQHLSYYSTTSSSLSDKKMRQEEEGDGAWGLGSSTVEMRRACNLARIEHRRREAEQTRRDICEQREQVRLESIRRNRNVRNIRSSKEEREEEEVKVGEQRNGGEHARRKEGGDCTTVIVTEEKEEETDESEEGLLSSFKQRGGNGGENEGGGGGRNELRRYNKNENDSFVVSKLRQEIGRQHHGGLLCLEGGDSNSNNGCNISSTTSSSSSSSNSVVALAGARAAAASEARTAAMAVRAAEWGSLREQRIPQTEAAVVARLDHLVARDSLSAGDTLRSNRGDRLASGQLVRELRQVRELETYAAISRRQKSDTTKRQQLRDQLATERMAEIALNRMRVERAEGLRRMTRLSHQLSEEQQKMEEKFELQFLVRD